MMMPGGGRNGNSANQSIPSGSGFAMPTRSGSGSGSSTGWIIGAVIFGIAATYWYVGVGKARSEAAVIRSWASSSPVKTAVRSAIETSGAQRKKVVASRKSAVLAAYKTAAQKAGAKALAANPVPFELSQLVETKLLKAPAQTVPALQNAAANMEAASVFGLVPKLASDKALYNYTGWGLLSGTAIFTLIGAVGLIPKRRTFAIPTPALAPAPVASAIPIAAPRIAPPTIVPPAASTPFPPPPDTVPTINPPTRGSIAAGVAAVASSSAEVTRLVKRLEELESLSEKLKGERDETRKELSWTQVALDDFKKRVADATTMAAASAAQSAGASEQRAAHAELRVTEAVEHINEALLRAVETEHGVSRAQELAQTAEERATHAEIRSQEIQFQLARAMERLADLEQLASSTRIGGMPGPVASISNMIPPTPAPVERNGHRNGHLNSIPSPIDDMLAAAAKPAPKPVIETANSPIVATADENSSETYSVVGESETASNLPPRGQRVPPPRLTNTKMSDIEAGLNLARSIRSRTQKAAATVKANGEE